MNRLARIAAALTLAFAVAAPAAAKSVEIEWMADRHLSDLLKKPAYRQVWRSQILSEVPAEDQAWIQDALSSSGPHGEVRVNGKRYLASTLRINEQRAVAAHAQFHEADRIPAHNESGKRTEAFTLRHYGRPDTAEKEALRDLIFQEWKAEAEAEKNARQKPGSPNE